MLRVLWHLSPRGSHWPSGSKRDLFLQRRPLSQHLGGVSNDDLRVREIGLQHRLLCGRLAGLPADGFLGEEVGALVADSVLAHHGILHRARVDVRFDLDKAVDETQAVGVLKRIPDDSGIALAGGDACGGRGGGLADYVAAVAVDRGGGVDELHGGRVRNVLRRLWSLWQAIP